MKSAALRIQIESALNERFPAAIGLRERPAPLTVPTGVLEIDSLTGGLARGALTEIYGPASSGRTSLLLSILAQATGREEACALVDAGDTFDPHSAAAAGVNLARLLWVRCGSANSEIKKNYRALEQALKATDLLLQAGGFGVVAIDMGDVPPQIARRVPLTSWFRFRRAVENTPTVLLVIEREASARNCASLVLKLISRDQDKNGFTTGNRLPVFSAGTSSPEVIHGRLLCGLRLRAEVVRRVQQRKPSASVAVDFRSRAVWSA